MRISDILKQKDHDRVVTVLPSDPIPKVASLLLDQQIGAVVVREASGRVAGLLGERDIVRGLAKERAGVLIGSGIGGLDGIEQASILVHEKGPRRLSPFFIPGRIINLASGYVSIIHSLKGPNSAVVTACSTGARTGGRQ